MIQRTLVVEAGPGATEVRLDAFLRTALPDLSRRLVRRLVDEGGVRVNGRPASKGLRLRAGDVVSVPVLPRRLVPEPGLALPIVYEDAALVVLDKPGGMPGHALDPRDPGTAAAFLVARYPEMLPLGDALAPGLVHRLDTGTSGLLLAARTAPAHAALRAAFRTHRVEKRYLALVAGDAARLDGRRIEVALAHDPGDRRRMVAAPPGARAWPAETCVVARAAGRSMSLVEVVIHTGVTHQVRAHLALSGHPVLNDAIYGGPPAALGPGRHALHAAALTLPHPNDGRPLALTAPLPADLAALWATRD